MRLTLESLASKASEQRLVKCLTVRLAEECQIARSSSSTRLALRCKIRRQQLRLTYLRTPQREWIFGRPDIALGPPLSIGKHPGRVVLDTTSLYPLLHVKKISTTKYIVVLIRP